MFRSIYTFELNKMLRQPATYFYFLVFFAIALFTLLGTAGFFDGVPPADKEVRLLNSAYEIHFIFQYFNKFFLFLLPAVIGAVIYKDFSSNIYSILFSYPVKKSDYLLGKFLSSLTVVFLITLSIGMAFFLGEFILGEENPMIEQTNYWGYAVAYFIFTWPNMFVYGLLVFVVVAALRNIYAGFIAVILLLFIQIITDNLFEGNPVLFTLFDPFGQNAVAHETRFWTIAEQNTLQIPVQGMVLWNRLLWTSLALLLFGFFYKKFELEQESFRLIPGIKKSIPAGKASTKSGQSTKFHSKANIDFSLPGRFKSMLKLSAIDFRFIVKNWIFHALLLFGIMALVFAMSRVTNRADMTLLPLTRIVLSVPMIFFSTIIMLLTFVYAGMLVHRPRIAKISQFIDSTATPNWVLLGSKILALLQVQLLLLLVLMLCGIGLQVYNGFYQFEIGLYLFHLFLLTFPGLIIWAILSVFIHTIVPNLYLGIFLLLLIWIGKDQLPQIGIETYLLRFNSPPALAYSDLNGFGHGLLATFIINSYWLSFSGILLIVTYLLWERGYTYSLKERLAKAVRQMNGFVIIALLAFVIGFFYLGNYIYREENSPFKTVGNNAQILEDFNANFGKYKSHIQPKITAVKLNMELFPASNSLRVKGHYRLVNKTSRQIDTLLVKTGFDEITKLSTGIPSKEFDRDETMQFAVHLLQKPMLPGDTIRMDFEIKNKPNTLFYRNSGVLQNGTFLRTDILPRVGYFFEKETREPDDSLSRYANFYAPDADLVDVETIISTHISQTALAPGALQKQWTENKRNYFHYKTKEIIKFAFAFNSGAFSVSKTDHQGTKLEVYHHKNHTFNLEDLKNGLQASLGYNSRFFGPYQHEVVRTIEFPYTEGTYASVMGNAIPTSEVRFILRNGDEKNQINVAFYVQAHELTHQWWGNQLVPANARGAKMLTESITEYISLMIYKRAFGQEKALHFLGLQRQRYLEGRTKETAKESPLYLVQPDQEYIAYGKGAMAFNTLQYYVGEEKLNRILKDFLEDHRFRTDQYPTSTDLIVHIKKNIPSEFHYIIRDMMETITFYDIKLNDIKSLPENKLELTFTIKKTDSTQQHALEAGKVFLTVGQYDRHGTLVHTDVIEASTGKNKVTISQRSEASSILLDPFLHYIEMDRGDNRKFIGRE